MLSVTRLPPWFERAFAAFERVFSDSVPRDLDEIADTLADSIAVGRPRNTIKACRVLEESGGTSLLVSDDDILIGEKLLGSSEEIYAEPAAGD